MGLILPETNRYRHYFRHGQWFPLGESETPKTNPQVLLALGGLGCKSLTMSYFHRRTSTIIGAKVFHGPVRDGKGWDHLAMVVKRSLLNGSDVLNHSNLRRSTTGVFQHESGWGKQSLRWDCFNTFI